MITGLIRLTRWRDHLPFTLPATLLGVNMALTATEQTPDARIILVLLANTGAVTFAFMVNDIEDAPDDARDPARAAQNAITSGLITPRLGWFASVSVGLLALLFFAGVNAITLLTGTLTVSLGGLYSWRKVRLKALPVIDVIAHVLMLSSLLFLAGYFAYSSTPGAAWWVALGVGFISAYGQLYNQLRDYDMDQAAGLRNTAYLLGRTRTQWAMYASLGLAAFCLGISVLLGLWPLWLGFVGLGLLPILLIFKTANDMRGTTAIDATGQLQLGAMLLASAIMIIWLVVIIMV
ncbi:MAG: UbiA family prenyltransferase [Anaerolineae bacterium]|nr:UbiA family prenyltransferase [Anaerolineae bacterium]